jgi:hypothetical protein
METRTVRVERSLTELQNEALAFGPPKPDAGRRTVSFPELIVPVLREHLASFARPGDDGLVGELKRKPHRARKGAAAADRAQRARGRNTA